MNKLSVVISAFNEEEKIKDCLDSVKWADQIIFVDGSSTDKTVEIAKKYTSDIFIRPNNLMLNVNKNYGFSKATGEWILSLDADERVSPELKEEILSILNSQFSILSGFWIPRKNIIFGEWIRHAGWYPDHQLRLFRRKEGRFPEKHVHEMINIEGKTEYLKEHIIHYNYQTIFQFLRKLEIYAPNEAEQLVSNNYVFNWKDAIRFPFEEFISRFFAREGYKDGFHGLTLSLLMAFYHFIIFANLWEKEKFKKYETGNVLVETEKEINNIKKKTEYWFLNEKLKTIKNPIGRSFIRLLAKLRPF